MSFLGVSPDTLTESETSKTNSTNQSQGYRQKISKKIHEIKDSKQKFV